jgi:hypothetical protein
MRTPAAVFAAVRAHYAAPHPDVSNDALSRLVSKAFRHVMSRDPDPEILSHLTSEQGRPPQ